MDLGFGKRPLSHIGLLESNSNKINCFITVSLFFSNSSPPRRTICLSYLTETNVSLRFKFGKKSETLKCHLIFSTKITLDNELRSTSLSFFPLYCSFLDLIGFLFLFFVLSVFSLSLSFFTLSVHFLLCVFSLFCSFYVLSLSLSFFAFIVHLLLCVFSLFRSFCVLSLFHSLLLLSICSLASFVLSSVSPFAPLFSVFFVLDIFSLSLSF